MHWLVRIAQRNNFPGAADLNIAASEAPAAAWATVVRACAITPEALAEIVAKSYRLELGNLDEAEPTARKLIPEKLARKYTLFPLRETDRQIVVATGDPMNIEAEQAVAFASGREAVFAVAPPDSILDSINSLYSPNRSVEALLSGVSTEIADAVKVVEELAPEQVDIGEVESAPVVKLTNLILHDAIAQNASDIHIEPGQKQSTVRFRIDGVLRPHLTLPPAAHSRVVSRIKVLGKLDIADRLRPQDGRTRVVVDGSKYDVRISTVPTREAEKAVIRILRPDSTRRLDESGLPSAELMRLRQLLQNRNGIVLVTGPTGSGKTTTLYAALKELAVVGVNISTVEDPVEYELGGITQIQVDTKRGVTFASALRSLLRQDPDIILIGEIRDLETAEIAVQASMTGHLVLATLHTNDAVSVVARLVDLGLDRPAIAASLRGAVAQRLVRRVCAACAAPITDALTDEEEKLSRQYGVRPTVRTVGCAKCGEAGYRGRIPVAEVLTSTTQFGELIAQSATPMALQRAALAGGMRPLREVALEWVRAGLTTLQEVDRVLGEGTEESQANVKKSEAPTVLVVDDDIVERQVAVGLLEKQGYRVLEAGDGEEGLKQLADNSVSVVVLDLQMPRLDGKGFLIRTRSNPRTATTPVIVLTSADDRASEVAAMDEGADDYVCKPFDPSRFMARVRAALRRSGG